ncbi:phage major capsid protein [Aeromonas salmonicida]|uniref:phage major capsid protein n=1 Tax=Aeromonas salmonicida TaxID=645 RepID=UPI003CFCF1CE
MENQETIIAAISEVATKQAEFNEQNSADVTALKEELAAAKAKLAEIEGGTSTKEEVKAQQVELAETKSVISKIQYQVEKVLDTQVKGIHYMPNQNTQKPTTVEILEVYRKGLIAAAKAGQSQVEMKSIFHTQVPEMADLYIKGYEEEIIKPLVKRSKILSVIGARPVPSTRNTRKRVRTEMVQVGVGKENILNDILKAQGGGAYKMLEAHFVKLFAFNIASPESVREGDFDLDSLAADVEFVLGAQAADVILRGAEEVKGLLNMFGDVVRYDQYEATVVDMAKFGKDYVETMRILKHLKRSLDGYIDSDSFWAMNGETFDQLTCMTVPAGLPVVANMFSNDYDGTILNLPVVCDPKMPTMEDAGQVFIMLGNFKRAVQVYTIDGEHKWDQLAMFGGNHHIYDSVNFGMRMEDAQALKGLRVPAAKK